LLDMSFSFRCTRGVKALYGLWQTHKRKQTGLPDKRSINHQAKLEELNSKFGELVLG